jgi:hypothetical protein
MTTLHTTTASNRPQITRTAVTDVERLIDEYEFSSPASALTVTVTDPGDDTNPYLELHGPASFDVNKLVPTEDGTSGIHEYEYTEEFLTRLAPSLEEQLVVETVGAEKYRFPLVAGQWVAWPDGTVTYNTFDHSPARPPDADEA